MSKQDEKQYLDLSYKISSDLTKSYSTSFSRAIGMLEGKFRPAISALYAMARLADEIVDTHHEVDQGKALAVFHEQVMLSLDLGFSSNPVLQAFQDTALRYDIDRDLIEAFFRSMEMDLSFAQYDEKDFTTYVYGSAEVIGLMCLTVFCERDKALYKQLEPAARSLGAGFQKVNFLRDLLADHEWRGRSYFPGITIDSLTDVEKKLLEDGIAKDFAEAEEGIKRLPGKARKGVMLALAYYRELLAVIAKTPAAELKKKRVRVSDGRKVVIAAKLLFGRRGRS